MLYKILSKGPNDKYFEKYFVYWGFEFHEEIHITSILQRGSPTLQYKHAIQAIYEAGTALARIPTMTPNQVPRAFAGLYLRNQLIGLMKWQHKSTLEMGMANATLDLLSTNSSDAVQPMPMNKRADFKTIIDPTDNRYVIIYQETG